MDCVAGNAEDKDIAKILELSDRIDVTAESEVFNTLKDLY